MFGKSEDRAYYQETGRPIGAMAGDLPDKFLIDRHSHRRSQLIYGVSGSITVATEHGTWVAPADRGVWIPGGTEHAMWTTGKVGLRTLYVEPDHSTKLPAACVVVEVTMRSFSAAFATDLNGKAPNDRRRPDGYALTVEAV